MHVQFNNVRSHTFLEQNITYFYTADVGALNLFATKCGTFLLSAATEHSFRS